MGDASDDLLAQLLTQILARLTAIETAQATLHLWAVDPAELRTRAGIVLPLLFGFAMALGTVTAWLAGAQ